MPICLGLPGLFQTNSNQVKHKNKIEAKYTFCETPSRLTISAKGLNFAYKSPKMRPSTGTAIHKNIHKTSGVIEVLASSLLIIPGTVNSSKIKNPKDLPLKVCFVVNKDS